MNTCSRGKCSQVYEKKHGHDLNKMVNIAGVLSTLPLVIW